MVNTDTGLIQRIQQHDANALSEFYDRHSTPVYSVALFITRNALWAEEATQDAFLRLWTSAELYQSTPGGFSVWLIAITRRCAIKILSREFRKAPPISLIKDTVNPLSNSSVEEEIRPQEVQPSLVSLASQQHQIIAPNFDQGPCLNRATAHLDISHDTIKDFARLSFHKLSQVFHQT